LTIGGTAIVGAGISVITARVVAATPRDRKIDADVLLAEIGRTPVVVVALVRAGTALRNRRGQTLTTDAQCVRTGIAIIALLSGGTPATARDFKALTHAVDAKIARTRVTVVTLLVVRTGTIGNREMRTLPVLTLSTGTRIAIITVSVGRAIRRTPGNHHVRAQSVLTEVGRTIVGVVAVLDRHAIHTAVRKVHYDARSAVAQVLRAGISVFTVDVGVTGVAVRIGNVKALSLEARHAGARIAIVGAVIVIHARATAVDKRVGAGAVVTTGIYGARIAIVTLSVVTSAATGRMSAEIIHKYASPVVRLGGHGIEGKLRAERARFGHVDSHLDPVRKGAFGKRRLVPDHHDIVRRIRESQLQLVDARRGINAGVHPERYLK
jgi:hypothetical protein